MTVYNFFRTLISPYMVSGDELTFWHMWLILCGLFLLAMAFVAAKFVIDESDKNG